MKAPILYSPMMGMGASLSVFAETPAVVIEDYFFESTTAYEITPLATGTVTDYHDTFDLDTNDYMPEALPDDEGYWDVMPELVTNGGFDADSGWTKGTGWTISSGKAIFSGSAFANLQASSNILVIGETYELVLTAEVTNGSFKVQSSGSSDLITQSSSGTYSAIFTATSTVFTIARATVGETNDFSIDNVSVTEYAISPLDV